MKTLQDLINNTNLNKRTARYLSRTDLTGKRKQKQFADRLDFIHHELSKDIKVVDWKSHKQYKFYPYNTQTGVNIYFTTEQQAILAGKFIQDLLVNNI
jgi:hypothetical protein